MYAAKAKTITKDGVKWFNAETAAELLHVHITQAYALMRSGKLKATRDHDKIWRTTLADIQAYRERRKFWKSLHGEGKPMAMPDGMLVE